MNIKVANEFRYDSTLEFVETEYFYTLNEELDALIASNELSYAEKVRVLSLKSNEYEMFRENDYIGSNKLLLVKKYPQIFTIHDLLISRIPTLKKYFISVLHKDREVLESDLNKLNLDYVINEVSTNEIKMLLYVIKIGDEIDLKAWIKDFSRKHLIDLGFYYYLDAELIWKGDTPSYSLHSERFMEPDLHSLNNSKKGFREDLESGYRSSWEANIARWLNYLNIEYKYEEELFNTEAGPYIPDFVIHAKLSALLIEVKGWLDRRSKDLVVAFIREEFHGYEYELIDSSFYALLHEKYASIIPNWELNAGNISTQIQARVVGLTVGKRMKVVKELAVSDGVTVVWEKTNNYDAFAVKVISKEGLQVGYISKDFSPYLVLKMQQGFEVEASVKSIDLIKNVVHISISFIGDKSLLNNLEHKLKSYVGTDTSNLK